MRSRGRARGAALAAVTFAVAAVALPALAQDEPGVLDVKVEVTPKKAGTPKHPRSVTIKVKARLSSLGPNAKPIVDKGTIRLGKGVLWNGAKHPKCTATILNDEGVNACPKRSVFGRSTGGITPVDPPKPKITVVNGGTKRAFAYVQLTSPARISRAVPIRIEQRSGEWAYQLSYDVPPSLQTVAGVPISVPVLQGTIGKGDILATTFCPRDRTWKYDSTTTLLDGRVVKHAGTAPCRR